MYESMYAKLIFSSIYLFVMILLLVHVAYFIHYLSELDCVSVESEFIFKLLTYWSQLKQL